MKLGFAIILFLFLVVLGWNIYSFIGEQRSLDANLSDVQNRLAAAQANEANLKGEAQYLSNPLNLEKELRARFNYKKPGESMIIIVPAATSSPAAP